jgi:hypothetical protein
VFGSDDLHFDHTSILKTIARRFLSNSYPYLGARYAAAHDLSEVLEGEIRTDQFRPFIPYALTNGASGMCLDVPSGSVAVGTPVWQFTPNRTDAQHFRFEDAGGGFVHIRTLAGLYLTADLVAEVPGGLVPVAIKQDRKFGPDSPLAQNADRQRWSLASSSVVALHSDGLTISCAAYPGMVLQPADGSMASGAAVVLSRPGGHSPLTTPNPWMVQSPLLASAGPVNQA